MLIPATDASAVGVSGFMLTSLHIANTKSSQSLRSANDYLRDRVYIRRVKHSRPKRFTNWFLREWMGTLDVSQAALVEKTGLTKTAISLLYNDRQDYTPAIIQDVAEALNIAPYELLMHPENAMAIRSFRQDAFRVVETSKGIDRGESEIPSLKTGT